MSTEAPRRLPLRRPPHGRWVGGVAAGLAAHLGLPVAAVRGAFVLLTLAGGAGAVVYVFWWVLLPAGDPHQAAVEAEPAALRRLAPRLRQSAEARRVPLRQVILGLLLLGGAAYLVAMRLGWDVNIGSWLGNEVSLASWLPVLVVIGGVALAWSQLDAAQRGRGRESGGRSAVVLRLGAGVVLVLVGVQLFIGQDTPGWAVVQATVASLAVLAGVALVLAPWWLRLVRELGDERAARAREAERADIAAHLHDSVLQTLALIRARADDPEDVARMARAQERELREWLYDDRTAPGTSLAAELRALVGEVEDGRAATVEVVVVGDCVPTDATTALLQATREALVNAAVHGEPPVTVYLEVTDATAQVFVRDRGDGFDMDAIAPDRFGVRESIIGRLRRRGGSAEVTSRPGWGTEVRLCMPREEAPTAPANHNGATNGAVNGRHPDDSAAPGRASSDDSNEGART